MNGTLEPGQRFADYSVEALLGRGGMGEVYLAVHLPTGHRTALKVLAEEIAGDEEFRRRFLREWEIAAQLDHPNVIPVEGAGETDGRLYIAMRYVEGTNLRDLVRSAGPLEPRRAFALLRQVAGALDAAHAGGVVHRDVKPANIIIERTDAGEHAWLCDFGLGVRADATSQLTRSGETFGTAAYMAPEQAAGEPADPHTDAYALACVLFECLTGRPPYQADTMVATIAEHLHAPIPRISDAHPELGAQLDAVFQRALAKTPGDRYPSCGALLAAAEKGSGQAAGAPGTPAWGLDDPWDEDSAAVAAADDVFVRYAAATGPPPAAADPAPQTASEQGRSRRRLPAPLVLASLALAAVVLATAGTLAVAATTGDPPETVPNAALVTTAPSTTEPAPATEAPPGTEAAAAEPAAPAPAEEAPAAPEEHGTNEGPPATEAPERTDPPATEPPDTEPPAEPPDTEPPATEPPETTEPPAAEPPSGPATARCVNGWTTPERRKPAGDAIRKATGTQGTLTMVEIRMFDHATNGARFWYVKASGIAKSPDKQVRARWLVRRPEGKAPWVVASAPFNSEGFASAGWKEFDAAVPYKDRKTYNTIARNLRGCLDGT